MSRHSFPEEIGAPDLNDRRLHIFDGCDDSTTRQLAVKAQQYSELKDLPYFLQEGVDYPDTEHLYTLTSAPMEQYISHGVIYTGIYGMKLYRFSECSDDDWNKFCQTVGVQQPSAEQSKAS